MAKNGVHKRQALRPGCDLLKEWLLQKKMSPTALAERLGIDQGGLSKILLADRKPSLPTAILFKDETGIPVESWQVPTPPKPRAPRFRRQTKTAAGR